jgi:hypothetical protein
MPDTPTTAEKEQVLEVNGNIRFIKKEFTEEDGKIPKGWSFAVPQISVPTLEISKGASKEQADKARDSHLENLKESLKSAIDFIGKNDSVTGTERLLDEINSLLAARVRTFVSNNQSDYKGPDGAREKAKYYTTLANERADRILFTVADCKEWYPGKRAETDKSLARQALECSQANDIRGAVRNSLKLIFKGLTTEELERRVDATLAAGGVTA